MKKKTNTKSIWITVIFLLLLLHFFRLADRNDWFRAEKKDPNIENIKESLQTLDKEVVNEILKHKEKNK